MCHQSVSLTARALEEAGIVTVVIGAAYDIMRACGTPRTIYNDLPLGNPVGRPFETRMQWETVSAALSLAQDAREPGVIVDTGFTWSETEQWKSNFFRVNSDELDELRRKGEENRARRLTNKEKGLVRRSP